MLLAQVRRSAAVGWSGYGESRGSLVLPEVSQLGELPTLFGGTQRTRVWWRAADEWRVDVLSLVGETDTTQDLTGSWTWVSADRRATRLDGAAPIRLPSASDLVAPVLGRRLAGSSDVSISRLGERRLAGRATAGLRLVPRRPSTSTVDSVELWVDRQSGLVLEVTVRAGGRVVLDSLLLDLHRGRPSPQRAVFHLPDDAQYNRVEVPDLAAQADRFSPFLLPATLAGSSRSDQVEAFRGVAGVATYGSGLATFTVLPLPRRTAREVIGRLTPTMPDAARAELRTPLFTGLVGRSSERADGRGYLLVGTVPAGVLAAALDQLLADTPAVREVS